MGGSEPPEENARDCCSALVILKCLFNLRGLFFTRGYCQMLERWRGKKVVVVSTTRCAVYNFNFSTFLQHSALDLSCLSIVCSRSYLLLSHFCFISSRFYFPSAAGTCSLKIHKHNRNNMNINSLHRGEKMRIKQLTLYTSINCLTRRIALCFIMLSVDLL